MDCDHFSHNQKSANYFQNYFSFSDFGHLFLSKNENPKKVSNQKFIFFKDNRLQTKHCPLSSLFVYHYTTTGVTGHSLYNFQYCC